MELFRNFLKWLNENSNDININLLAGLFASFIVLAFQTLVRTISLILASFFTLRYQLRFLWHLRKPERVFVVSGSIETPLEIKAVILAGPDADAANSLIATMGLIYPEADIHHVYSSAFPKELYKENLIVVGGPVNNSCTRDVLEIFKQHIYFQDFDLIIGDEKYVAAYDEHDEPISDYGVVVKVTNPFDQTKDLILVAGCDTHGVLGAATAISLKTDAIIARAKLRKGLGFAHYFFRLNYLAIVHCKVLGNDISSLDVVKVQRLPEIL